MMSVPRTDEELACERLRKALINGELPIGEFLSQRKLADIAGVSVVTVRSALRILERDGIVENVPRWGVRIPVETEVTLRDRYYIREVLEIAAVRRLVERSSASDAQLLRELAQRCDAAIPGDLATFAEVHFDLHHAIALCSGSALLVETLDRVFYRTRLLFDGHARLVRLAVRHYLLRAGYSVLDASTDFGSGSESGFGMLLGAGYDVRVGRNMSITPVANWFRGGFDGGSTNVLQIGVGVTSH